MSAVPKLTQILEMLVPESGIRQRLGFTWQPTPMKARNDVVRKTAGETLFKGRPFKRAFFRKLKGLLPRSLFRGVHI